MRLGVVDRLAVGGDLDEEVAASLEVSLDELVEAEHVLLLGELDVVGDVLEDLGHEHETALDGGGRLLLHDPHLVGRDDGGGDEAEEEHRAHCTDVVLDALGKPLAEDLEEEVRDKDKDKDKRTRTW